MDNNYIEKIKEYIESENGSIVSMMAIPKKEEDLTIGSFFMIANNIEVMDNLIVIRYKAEEEVISEMVLIKNSLRFAYEKEIAGTVLLAFAYSNFKQTEFEEFNEDVAIILQKK